MDKLEEVKKLKQLLDDGIIDEEDFAKKKAEILGILKQEAKKEEIIEEESKKETKSKSLEDYEKELMAQSEVEEETNEKSQTKSNDDYYQKEKIKAKAKLDAEEEIRTKRRNETKAAVDKGVAKTKVVLKWILAVIIWIFAFGSFAIIADKGIVYLPTGILGIILGCMACPKITEKTQKYEAYTMHKTAIVWILVILLFALMIINSHQIVIIKKIINKQQKLQQLKINKSCRSMSV